MELLHLQAYLKFMPKRFLSFFLILILTFKLNAQTCPGGSSSGPLPTKCFEIESILADACGSVEGQDEMIRLRIGPNAVALNSINTVVWQTSNLWLNFCSFNAAQLSKINTMNNSITVAGNCGRFIPVNPGGTIPAYAKVLFLTSLDFSATAHDFSGLTDTLYVIAQCAGNTGGHFTNSGNATRTLIIRTATCGDTVTWNSANLTGGDGATVNFTFSGTPSYVNNGCALPITPFSCDAGTTNPSYCNGTTVPLLGTATGTNCYVWQAADTTTGSFTDSTNLSTGFTIKPGYIGAVKLYLKAKANCSIKRDSVMFNATGAIGTLFAGNDTTLCNGNTFTANASSTATGTYAWTENGPGTFAVSTILKPTYTPTAADTGAVIMVVTQTTSCGALKDTVIVTFISKKSPNFTLSDSNFCYNNVPINITATPTVAGGVFSSNIGSFAGNVHTFNAVGNFIIKYKIGTGACADSLTKPINSFARANPNFTLSDTLVCKNSPLVILTPTQTGGVFSGIRVIGNQFTPDTSGTFTLKYKIANGICVDSFTRNVTVNEKPSPLFTSPKTLFCLNDAAVTLTPINTGGVFSGSNLVGNLFTPSSVGVFVIKYKISTTYCADSTTLNLSVVAKPDPEFTLSDTLVCLGSGNIILTPTQAGGTFYGTDVSGQQFTPNTSGIFFIKYVINNTNCKDSTEKKVTVLDKVDASFTTSDSVFCINDNIASFTPTQTGGLFSGTNVIGQTFRPLSVGSFKIKHLVANQACVDSAFRTMQVFDKPTANFTFLPSNPTVEDTVQFTFTGTNATAWLWRFGDANNSSSILQNPRFLFTDAKVYNTSLVVTNDAGCRDSISKTVPVLLKESLFIPNVFTPQSDGTNDFFTIKSSGINEFNMKIYNRWGGLIFETNQITPGWEGTYDGNPCPVGVYFYIITATSNNKKTYNLNGTVTLLR
ncbi:MAG: gliding motility-associated C-terminal domain-containing protein [Candidatus Methylacidiphilales bacterium]